MASSKVYIIKVINKKIKIIGSITGRDNSITVL